MKRARLRGASALQNPLPKHSRDGVCSAKNDPENPSIEKRMYSIGGVVFFAVGVQKVRAGLPGRFAAPNSFRKELGKTPPHAGTDSLRCPAPAEPNATAISRAAWPGNRFGCGLLAQASRRRSRNSRDAPSSAAWLQPPPGERARRCFSRRGQATSARAQRPRFAEPGPAGSDGACKRRSPLTTLLEAQSGWHGRSRAP